MLALISPAKRLNFDPRPGHKMTTPELLTETRLLAETTRALRASDIKKLMKLSDSLAHLNYERFQDFDVSVSRPQGSKQAALAFDGDTYTGLEAGGFSLGDMDFAQKHLGILSGLYGILRPLDAILPYRLEMGTRLKNPRGASLYDFWGDRVARQINKRLVKLKSEIVINLASVEYASVIPPGSLKAQVVTPMFKEMRGGQAKIISFSAKRARGTMARYIIKKRLTEPRHLKAFTEDGYKFQPSGSTPTEWLFLRG
jgi:cytoplasmic iron level regulating protein YaaA (DUF328/UPF0246 family)